MTMNATIVLGIGSPVAPFIQAIESWRDEQLPDHVRPFIVTAQVGDEGAVTSRHPGNPADVLISDLRREMTPEVWQENRAIGTRHEKAIKTWLQSLFQLARQESHIRIAASKGLIMQPGLRLVLVSTTFDPVGSALLLLFASIIRQVAKEGNLPLSVHLCQIAPDAYSETVNGVPAMLVLKGTERQQSDIRTVQHLQEIQAAFLDPDSEDGPSRRLFRDCWLVSNDTARGTCLNNFAVLTQNLVAFVSILQHPDLRLPDPAGKLTGDGKVPMLNSLGVYEIRLVRTTMREAFRSQVTQAALGFLKDWQTRKFDRQKIDSEIRDLVHERRIDQIRERFSRDDTGRPFHVAFTFQEHHALERDDAVAVYAADLKAAWQEYRRQHEPRLFEETVHRHEQLIHQDSEFILKNCRSLVNSAQGELPAGIAYLSAWLNRESAFVGGSNISLGAGFQELRERVTAYWDDLMGTLELRRELRNSRQAIVDKTSLSANLERQLATTRQLFAAVLDDDSLEDVQVENSDPGDPRQRLEHEIEALNGRLAATGRECATLVTREQELSGELGEIDRGLEDPGTRRTLFQERIEDKALSAFSDTISRLTESAVDCRKRKEDEWQAEAHARRVARQWFLFHNFLIGLLAILYAGSFHPGLIILTKIVAPLTVAAMILNTMIGSYRYFTGTRRTWHQAREISQDREREQQSIQGEAVAILAELERSRADFAACFYAIEWYHSLRENLAGQLLNLMEGFNGLKKMQTAAQAVWEGISPADSENIKEYPDRSHLYHIWQGEREMIGHILADQDPGAKCSNFIVELGPKAALEKFDQSVETLVDDRFREVPNLDITGLLEHLDQTVPEFSLEEVLRNGLNNSVPLVNVHEFARNQGATETFLVGFSYREEAHTAGLFDLLSRDKKLVALSTGDLRN